MSPAHRMVMTVWAGYQMAVSASTAKCNTDATERAVERLVERRRRAAGGNLVISWPGMPNQVTCDEAPTPYLRKDNQGPEFDAMDRAWRWFHHGGTSAPLMKHWLGCMALGVNATGSDLGIQVVRHTDETVDLEYVEYLTDENGRRGTLLFDGGASFRVVRPATNFKWDFRGCEYIGFSPETILTGSSNPTYWRLATIDDEAQFHNRTPSTAAGDECFLVSPYFNGIGLNTKKDAGEIENNDSVPPWDLDYERKYLLQFAGTYGNHSYMVWRRDVIEGAKDYQEKHPITKRGFHVLNTVTSEHRSDFWTGVKQTNASAELPMVLWAALSQSVFSLQLEGDTYSRRGLFDAMSFGNIPVVSEVERDVYERLWDGHLFPDENGARAEDVFVVLPREFMLDTVNFIQYLDNMPQSEIECRRRKIRLLMPFLTVGWDATSHTILSTFFSNFARHSTGLST